MTVPICVPESAPAASRGLLGTLTEAAITFGGLVASLTCGALSGAPAGWRWLLGPAALPAALQLVGFAFMSQTPRLLISRGRDAQAHDVRHRIRGGGKHVQDEHEAIKADLDAQEQLFQQVSGVNTVIYYSANITTLAAPATCTCTCVCGFCFRNLAVGPANGSCMPIVSSHNSSEAAGRCADTAALGVGGLTWAPNWRPTYAWLPITGMLLYITPFSPGLGAMPWTITVESFPVWARSTCISITTAVNWSFNLLVSLTFLPLAHALTHQGTFFYLFFGCTVGGLAVFFVTVPETGTVQLEEMPMLFSQPWGLHEPGRERAPQQAKGLL
ncbi:proton myo-inositol cotransporter-like [Pollicipes pollicipes]|uniref:proton myo-inositol cotransporter-like n=1 Tax=Pollicipes pollicipes TaxID=41117 RepID=UPI001884A0DE|nr:proton myo-inositol cotransporter-like [Pollicipes pollicipes]